LTQDEIEYTMKEIKGYMEGVVDDIIKGFGLDKAQSEMAKASMAMALGAMSHTEYADFMQKMMGGGMDMGGIGGMMNFEMPDIDGVNRYIYDNITKWLEKNLPSVEGLDKNAQEAILEGIQNELREPNGPDFSKLPVVMSKIGMERKDQDFVLGELRDFFMGNLKSVISEFKGVPKEITSLMTKAMAGVITKSFDDLSGHTDDFVPDFNSLVPLFIASVGKLLPGLMTNPKLKDFINKQLVEEVSGEVGRQMAREGGPDFREFRALPGLVLLED